MARLYPDTDVLLFGHSHIPWDTTQRSSSAAWWTDGHLRVSSHPIRRGMPQIVQRPVRPQRGVGSGKHRPCRVIAQQPKRAPQRPPQRLVPPGRHQTGQLRLISRNHTNASGAAGNGCNARVPLRITVISCCPGSASATVAPNNSEARAPVETHNATSARSRCEPSCANSWSNLSSGMHRGARVTIFGRYRLQRCPAKGSNRVVVGMRAPAAAMPRQRERVDHRPGARLQMKVVEPTQHGLAMRHRRGLVVLTPTRLAGHRVHPRRRTRPTRSREVIVGVPPMRPGRLDRYLQPAAEITSLDPSRLVPTHPDRPQEPEPSQQIHPVRTAASSQAAHTPPTRRRTRRPARPPRRHHQQAETARTALPSPPANPAAAPPARTTPAAHPHRCSRAANLASRTPPGTHPRGDEADSSVNRSVLTRSPTGAAASTAPPPHTRSRRPAGTGPARTRSARPPTSPPPPRQRPDPFQDLVVIRGQPALEHLAGLTVQAHATTDRACTSNPTLVR